MVKKIITEYKLDLIQKIHLSIILIIGISIFWITRSYNYPFKDIIAPFTPILLTFFTLTILLFVFLKKGLLVNESKLCKGFFILDFLVYQQNIDLKDKPIVSILKLKRAHGMPTVGLSTPQGSHSFYKFYVYLLNKSHSHKTELIGSKKNKNADKIINFLTENLDLKHEIYSPNFN